jgi:hypothetical protein
MARKKTTTPKKTLKKEAVPLSRLPKQLSRKFETPNPSLTEKLSNVECIECGERIPLKRIQVVKTEYCVFCAQDLEREGLGIKRHRIEYEGEGTEENPTVTTHLIRGG